MLEAFADPHTSMANVDVGRRIVLSRESLDILIKRGLRRSVRFSLV
jgi:hypothetical protein